MGLPALRHEPKTSRTRGPRLKVVTASKPRTGARRKTSSVESARSAFRVFAVVVFVVAVLGVGRVWLSVRAAEASIRANELRSDIKAERYEGDMLEVRQSALGSPSRIRAIAGTAMGMAPARKVTYLDLATNTKPSATEKVADAPGHSAVKRFVSDMMDLSAGEAQVLLVGDVGLASQK